ncbi:MAG: hypothetical protein K6E50_12040 [Lachnospiraceae bacterium]|nr:hypothetical protein [Lachnospiraceae bacterium]
MIYESNKLKLEEVGTVLLSPAGDCLICKDLRMDGATMYTVLRVPDHEIVRMLISVFEEIGMENSCLVDSFVAEGSHIFVFPYRKERPLDQFYMGDAMPLERCEDICINVILACMTSGLPWPVLYLILDQWKINLNKDDSVFLSYTMDLTGLDPLKKERDCTVACARIILQLLEGQTSQKADSYILLKKKIGNQSYNKFTELYRDIRIAAVPKGRMGIFFRIRHWFSARSDTFFGILFWICLILAIIALAMLATNLLTGDVPWLRMFINNFKRIGTESLLQ